MGLYTEDDVLVGAAAHLLAEQQAAGQAGRLAHHGHVVRPPRLAVFVHHSHPCGGGAVPDALLGPGEERRRGENWGKDKNEAQVLE